MASDSNTSHPPSTDSQPVTGSGSQNHTEVAFPKPTYSALVAAKPNVHRFNPVELPPRQYGRKEGRPAVSFSVEEVKAGTKRFEHTLIAKFTVGRPHINEIRQFLASNWLIQGQMTISDIWDGRHLIIMLDSESDVRIALTSPIRKIGHSLFRLFRWSPDYDFRQESSKRTVWVRLPNLPMHLYDKGYVKSILSSFAFFLDVDARTKACTSLNYARACIEIDVKDELPDSVWIQMPGGGFWQTIEYEGNLKYCAFCKLHGHDISNCKKKDKKAVVYDNIPIPEVVSNVPESNTSRDEAGWELVQKKKWRRKGVKSAIVHDVTKSMAEVDKDGVEIISSTDIVHITEDGVENKDTSTIIIKASEEETTQDDIVQKAASENSDDETEEETVNGQALVVVSQNQSQLVSNVEKQNDGKNNGSKGAASQEGQIINIGEQRIVPRDFSKAELNLRSAGSSKFPYNEELEAHLASVAYCKNIKDRAESTQKKVRFSDGLKACIIQDSKHCPQDGSS